MNRRDFIFGSGAALALGALAGGEMRGEAPAAGATPAPAPPGPAMMPPLVTDFWPLRRGVGMFTGSGGTIGWLASSEALVAVDTQFPNPAAIFLAGLPGRGGRTFDAVINTHHHGDHTGGNGVFKPATRTIIAQANVPALMLTVAKNNPRAAAPTLPDATFPEAWRREFGDETVTARWFGPAHTKGDIAVYFEKANVVHAGDLVFNRMYPVIDRPGGASIRHWMVVLEELARTYPRDAVYVFGHGNAKFGVTGGKDDLLAFRDYLAALLAHVEKAVAAGLPREQVVRLENFPGFPDLHVPPGRGNRLGANLGVAYDELTQS